MLTKSLTAGICSTVIKGPLRARKAACVYFFKAHSPTIACFSYNDKKDVCVWHTAEQSKDFHLPRWVFKKKRHRFTTAQLSGHCAPGLFMHLHAVGSQMVSLDKLCPVNE